MTTATEKDSSEIAKKTAAKDAPETFRVFVSAEFTGLDSRIPGGMRFEAGIGYTSDPAQIEYARMMGWTLEPVGDAEAKALADAEAARERALAPARRRDPSKAVPKIDPDKVSAARLRELCAEARVSHAGGREDLIARLVRHGAVELAPAGSE